ncbi:hypothetical protein [Pseudomonas sp. PSPC2-3]|jgi:hypothetical protein|uniref:Lipoprotein n=1 Tax=Siphoviridae sp. ctGO42 TaxID=2827566 RepID=A0A8S5LJ11_9CAUD|nr:MAG TPA: hypothetical protein [Siphoviridae sp. ctGO42]
MRVSILIAALAVLYGCSAPPSASVQGSRTSQASLGAKEAFLTLDPAGKNVPAKHYPSGKELLAEVKLLGGVRGEYETDAAFHGRVSKLGNFSIGGEASDSEIEFDQVSGEFTLKVSLHDAVGFGLKVAPNRLREPVAIYPSFIVGEDAYTEGQYSGQNAFGATATITKRSIDRYYLVFSPVPKPPLNMLFFNVSAKLNITASEMKEQRENIRVLFKVMSVPNYLQITKNYQQPTITNPYESVITNYFFSAKVFWVSVVNSKTGKVYAEEAKMGIKVL